MQQPASTTQSPVSISVIRTLGKGRAARAQLVDATMPNGRTIRCVEKVFAPGRLTRTIYRLSFQSPFAYQSNRDAILACYYRRRVASLVLTASDSQASVAEPLYVRFDQTDKAWVLAAEWVDGRGINPEPVDSQRLRRWLGRKDSPTSSPSEIQQIVNVMSELEDIFETCGLVGSGWQVAPRAMVSTANLLRVDDQYTVIDLESGIPAVLVPRYLIGGLRRGALPPFDDLDATKLTNWITDNEKLLLFRLGPEKLQRLSDDSQKLIQHSQRWKESEFACFRQPWRLFSAKGIQAYQQECCRRWHQNQIVDEDGAKLLSEHPIKARLIWYAGLIPGAAGRLCSRLIGRSDTRRRFVNCLSDSKTRQQALANWRTSRRAEWIASDRITEQAKLNRLTFPMHAALSKLVPRRLHRFLTDRVYRRDAFTVLVLLLFSSRYQSWLGESRISNAIDQWESSQRIGKTEASKLRDDLSGHEVRAYTRGFGAHIALKALAPIVVPAKVGGVAAFVASGNLWFLLPMLATPMLRSAVTMTSWWMTRHERIPHGEAFLAGFLPVIGSIAFPVQMFSRRPELSTFLIRDMAAKLGRQIPIYGGADSRTELAMIRASDFVVETMQCCSQLLQRFFGSETAANSSEPVSLPIRPRTAFGKWLDRQVDARLMLEQEESRNGHNRTKRAA